MRGYYPGSPADYYNQGIKASLEMYGIMDESVFQSFISQSQIQYDQTRALEQIITQKWVSLCMNGIEAWFEKRRTGFPVLAPLEFSGTINQGYFPRRLTYSEAERRLNGANLEKAVTRMGGDTQLTKVWWDNN